MYDWMPHSSCKDNPIRCPKRRGYPVCIQTDLQTRDGNQIDVAKMCCDEDVCVWSYWSGAQSRLWSGAMYIGDGRFGSKVGRIGPKLDKSGTFSDHISVHFSNLIWKIPRIVPFGSSMTPFWPKPSYSGVEVMIVCVIERWRPCMCGPITGWLLCECLA